MALKKDQQQSLNFLTLMATRILESSEDISLEKALETIAQDIKDFQEDTNTLLHPEVVDGKVVFNIVSLNKDFLRTRKPNDEALNLRAKKHGVGIDVKLVKAGDFSHDNSYVVTALRALADDIEGLGFELKELENEDLKADRIAELRGDEPVVDSQDEPEEPEVTEDPEDDSELSEDDIAELLEEEEEPLEDEE